MPKIQKQPIVIAYIMLALATIALMYFAWSMFSQNTQLSGDAELGIEQNRSIGYITPIEVKEMLDNKENFNLVDVRSEELFTHGHIEGSTNLPLQDVEDRFIEHDPNITIVVLDDGSNCMRSTVGANRFFELGFRDVRNLRSGTAGWLEAGYDLIKGVPPPDPIEVTELSPQELWSKLSEKPNRTLVIDLRKEEQYKKGHIPNAEHHAFDKIKEEWKNGDLPQDVEIIFYDELGPKGRVAARELIKLDSVNVKSLDGGYKAWEETNYGIDTDVH